MTRALITGLGLVMLAATGTAFAGVPGRVADLDWMAGFWAGPFGDGILEEHWMPPSEDSVIGSVRVTAAGRTRMMEFLAIEQVDDTLELRVRQWRPGMVPEEDVTHVMTLKAIGERQVTFERTGDFVFKTLGYSRPESDRFVIEADLVTGERLELDLRPR